MVRGGLLALAALVLSAGVAQADGGRGGDAGVGAGAGAGLAGSWQFKSWTYDDCAFGGEAHFRPTDDAGKFTCELTARQVCPQVTWIVRQSCKARINEGRVTITSTIEEFIEGPVTDNYWPDNFVLTMRSADRMSGSLVSHGVHPSEFTRAIGATS